MRRVRWAGRGNCGTRSLFGEAPARTDAGRVGTVGAGVDALPERARADSSGRGQRAAACGTGAASTRGGSDFAGGGGIGERAARGGIGAASRVDPDGTK